MKRLLRKWVIVILVIILLFVMFLWIMGFGNLINNSINSYTLDNSCNTDSDCMVKNTNCHDDDPYCKGHLKCVNVNWERRCFIPNDPLSEGMRVSCNIDSLPKSCKCQNNECVINQTMGEFYGR